jgi:flagella basal body P-ring formation protein FlgA
MKRFILAAALLTAGIAPATAQVAAATSVPTLRHEATVTSDVVRIGDLVDNAGAYGTIAIFRAPDLGHTGGVRADKVADALKRNGIFDLDTKGIVEVSVTRASRTIEVPEIESRIARALAPRYNLGAVENVSIAFDRDVRPIQMDPSSRADLRVLRMHYEAGARRFDVTFEVTGASSDRPAFLRYTGSAYEAVEAAVLRNPIGRGETIKESDITIERRARADIGGAAPAAATEVVGMAAKRALRAGDPVRATDLAKPELVQRNENVTLVFETSGLVLTLRGKAIESGTLGDTVNVLNLQSKRTVQGTVTGPGRITVTSMAPRIVAVAETDQPRNTPRRTQ